MQKTGCAFGLLAPAFTGFLKRKPGLKKQHFILTILQARSSVAWAFLDVDRLCRLLDDFPILVEHNHWEPELVDFRPDGLQVANHHDRQVFRVQHSGSYRI